MKLNGSMLKRPRKIRLGWLFAVPFLIIFTLFFIYPFLNGIAISFQNKDGQFVWFENYDKVLANGEFVFKEYFWRGLGNTVLFVVISVPLLIIIPLIFALLLEIKPKGYKVFRAILFMPTIFSISSVILMWKQVLQVETGFINSIFVRLGWNQIDFLGSQPWAWISILTVTVWWTMGVNMVILGAGLKNIDKSVYEAASIDGAGYFKSTLHITIPLLKNQIFVVLMMTTLASFNIYGQAQLLTSGGPEHSTEVLLMVILRYLYKQPHIAATMALILGLIMASISLATMLSGRKKEKA